MTRWRVPSKPSVSELRMGSLVLLATGMLINAGEYDPAALACVACALLPATLSLTRVARPGGVRRPVAVAAAALLALGGLWYDRRFAEQKFIPIVIAVLVVVVLIGIVRKRRTLYPLALLGAGLWCSGLVLNWSWGNATIDVFVTQQNAASALLHGMNPYSGVTNAVTTVLDGGVKVSAPLHFGYGPVFPLLEAPFRLAGDIRVVDLVAVAVTLAAVLHLGARAGQDRVAALLVAASPLGVVMVLFGWTDAVTVAGVSVWLSCTRTHPRLATVALAVALAGKPTAAVALLPMLWWSAEARRQLLWSALIAAVIVLPFALITGPAQFYQDAIGYYVNAAPRIDSLTLNSLLHDAGSATPFALTLLVGAGTLCAVLLQRPRTYGDLLTGTAVLTVVVFLFAKTAFFNYYYIAATLLLLAVAGDALPFASDEHVRAPAAFRAIAACASAAATAARRRPALRV